MFALGILLSFARSEPGCAEALSARPSTLRRSLAIIPGVAGPAPEPLDDAGRCRPSSVLLAGGGTAGHVSPLLALADCLRRRDPQVSVTALGTAAGLEVRLVPERGYPLRPGAQGAVARAAPPATCCACRRTLRRAVQRGRGRHRRDRGRGRGRLRRLRVDPGLPRGPPTRHPVVVHEQNARPGLANRLGARFAAGVGVTFPGTRLPHATLTGMPLRREIATLDRAAHRAEARERFGLDRTRPTLLVTGGSLGAQRLNDAFAGAVAALSAAGVQVLHVAGTGKAFTPDAVAGRALRGARVLRPDGPRLRGSRPGGLPRSGANTVCELTAVGLPAVYVPLPVGNGEQRLNAAAVVAAGGGMLVDDDAVTSAWVDDVVRPLALDESRLATMAAAAASVGERGGDELLADLVAAAASGGRP